MLGANSLATPESLLTIEGVTMVTTSSSTTKTEMATSLKLIKGLCEKTAYPHDVTSIIVLETHISWVLLTGHFAYKIKKPVNFGFLNFSTLEKRLYFCREELRLNRRFAENLYLDVAPITGTPDNPVVGGDGEAIEYAVKMNQFPANCILTQLAEAGNLSEDEIDQIADIVADVHAKVNRADEKSPFGDCDCIKKWFDENFEHINPRLTDERLLSQLKKIESWGFVQFKKLSGLMKQRKQQGFIRECHGDLHLGNMTLIDGKIVLFDCIEFNPMLRWIDVISEVAFLFIDLSHFGYEKLAYRFLNRYLRATGDYSGLVLLRFYLVYRALVRAKVTLLRQEQQNGGASSGLRGIPEYQGYANLAERFTTTRQPLLIITHGFSGSGKSTLSSQLAEKIGAIHIRSDIERKRLFGYYAMAKTGSGIDIGIYSKDAGEVTYRKLADLAKNVIDAGFPVIIDAAFLKFEQRDLFRKLAESKYARFVMIDCQASDDVLRQRILTRQQVSKDPSEATIDVLRHQLKTAEALTGSELVHSIRVDTSRNDALDRLMQAVTDLTV